MDNLQKLEKKHPAEIKKIKEVLKDKGYKTLMLHPNEIFIVECWRKKYRFGELIIKVSEGLPQFIEKVRIREYPPK